MANTEVMLDEATLSQVTVLAQKELSKYIEEVARKEVIAYLAENGAEIKAQVKSSVRESIKNRVASDLETALPGSISSLVAGILDKKFS